MEIEKLIEKKYQKLDLPEGFKKAPEYKLLSKKEKKKWRSFKKKTISSKQERDVT